MKPIILMLLCLTVWTSVAQKNKKSPHYFNTTKQKKDRFSPVLLVHHIITLRNFTTQVPG